MFFALSSYAQTKDSVLENIRELYKSINTENTLNVVKLENQDFLEEMTDGGGSLTGYFKGDEILKIFV